MKGQSLVDSAIGIMVATIVIGAVALPAMGQAFVTSTENVTNTTISSTGTAPENITVSPVEKGVVKDSETIYFKNASGDGSTTKLTSSDYNVISYENGKFEITTSLTDSTNDSYLVSYDYKPTGYIGGTTATILDFVPLALALALFVGAIGLVRSA